MENEGLLPARSRQSTTAMYRGEYDELFYKALPRWSRYLAIATALAFVPFFLSVFSGWNEIAPVESYSVSLGMIGFGVMSLTTTIVGIRLGFLPAKAHVSTADNPFQFWLTIVVMSLFSIGVVIGGGVLLAALLVH